MSNLQSVDFSKFYRQFKAPISALDCGEKCSPYNENGVPFCCDTRHAVPTAYQAEWAYLVSHTDLWHPWQADEPAQTQRLQDQTPAGQVLIECLGHTLCQRSFRALTCRAFPFFPYISRGREFLGLSYYWEYEDRCWVLSNLQVISPEYRSQFIRAYEDLFARMPEEFENFHHHSTMMRRIFGRRKRAIPLLHRNGFAYKLTPRNGRLRRVALDSLPKFGPYRIAARLPFPDELRSQIPAMESTLEEPVK